MVSAFGIAWRLAAALGAAALPIFVADMTGIARSDAILSLMLRLDYIVIVSILAIVVVRYARRHRTGSRTVSSGSNRYSAADRFFHILAFSSPVIFENGVTLGGFFLFKIDPAHNNAPNLRDIARARRDDGLAQRAL